MGRCSGSSLHFGLRASCDRGLPACRQSNKVRRSTCSRTNRPVWRLPHSLDWELYRETKQLTRDCTKCHKVSARNGGSDASFGDESATCRNNSSSVATPAGVAPRPIRGFSRRSDEALTHGDSGGLGAAGSAELGDAAADVALDGGAADHKARGYLRVGEAVREQGEHLALASGKVSPGVSGGATRCSGGGSRAWRWRHPSSA